MKSATCRRGAGRREGRSSAPCLVVPTSWPETFHWASGWHNHLGDADGHGNDPYGRDSNDPYDSEE
jgi:hypothetical protein